MISRILLRQGAKLAIFSPIKIRIITFLAKKRIIAHSGNTGTIMYHGQKKM